MIDFEKYEKAKERILSIDNIVRKITERPFRSVEDDIERNDAVNEYMDERVQLRKIVVEFENNK